jgi:gamma-glutamyl-gamma-aminobutyrate hydrolase PuuD
MSPDLMNPVPRIGLTTYRETAVFGVWNEPADLLPVTYADSVRRAGGVPMLLPPAGDELKAAAAVALEGVHGLLLTGGADVDPVRYGADRDPKTGPARADRDGWEVALTAEALRRDLPLLGVCRGMQVLAVALGGELTQHLPDRVHNDSHQPVVGKHGRHDVRTAPGSRLADIIGDRVDVATYHHQAVAVLPERLRACGWADDGTVEAFEVCDSTWIIGVQWHPEVDDGTELFHAFVAECARRIG